MRAEATTQPYDLRSRVADIRGHDFLKLAVWLGLMLLTALLAFAALAWACNPQAQLTLDKTVYEPGSAIIATGSSFTANAAVTVSGPTGATTVQTSPSGSFSTQLTAPATPGIYTVTASRPTGGFAPASFQVSAPPPPPAQPPAPDPPAQPAPQPAQVLPSPELVSIPQLPGTVILLRPPPRNQSISVSRDGSLSLLCASSAGAAISGTCSAASTRMLRASDRPLVRLSRRAFRAQPGQRVRVRFELTPRLLRRLQHARRLRMLATVIAHDRHNNTTTTTFAFTLNAPPHPRPRLERAPDPSSREPLWTFCSGAWSKIRTIVNIGL